MDSYYYLEPGFDSKKLTIAQLTSILSKHNVKLPGTSQRKYVYIELFDAHIKANAARLMAEVTAVEASDAGIQIISNAIPDTAEILNHGKHSSTRDNSPARKRIKPTEQITPVKPDTQSIKAPSLEKFFVSPSLPGIRSRIKTRVAELKEFWDSQSQKPESATEPSDSPQSNTESSSDLDDKGESLSEMYNVKKESMKTVDFRMINVAQYLTLIITLLVLGLVWFLTKKGIYNMDAITESVGSAYEAMTPYFEMMSNLTSIGFYKVVFRSMMQMVAPSVFFSMEGISTGVESMMQFVSDLDPVLMYSVGGLCMIVAFGLKE